MSNKVRVAARRVNVTAVIRDVVTEALYNHGKGKCYRAGGAGFFTLCPLGGPSWKFAGKKEFNRGVRKEFAELAEHTVTS